MQHQGGKPAETKGRCELSEEKKGLNVGLPCASCVRTPGAVCTECVENNYDAYLSERPAAPVPDGVESAREWRHKNDVRIVNEHENGNQHRPYTVEQTDVMLAAYAEHRAAEVRREEREACTDEEGNEYECRHDLWLSQRVREGKGAVILCETDDGDIGVFIGDENVSRGVGDTAFEAIDAAIRARSEKGNNSENRG